MRLEYDALRNLATGHTLNTQYEIAGPHEEALPDWASVGARNRALEGPLEVDLQYIDEVWRLVTDWYTGQDRENIEEFWHSVAGGEVFTFDPDSNTAGVPVNAFNCKLAPNGGYRAGRRRAATGSPWFKYSFVFLKV